MSKRTWRWKALTDDVRQVMATSPSLGAAAARLGVDKSTIFRWVKAGKLPAPSGGRRHEVAVADAVSGPQTAAEWAQAARETFLLTPTESALVDLGEATLALAKDQTQKVEVRLAAAARFQQITRQLNLDDEDANGEATQTDR